MPELRSWEGEDFPGPQWRGGGGAGPPLPAPPWEPGAGAGGGPGAHCPEYVTSGAPAHLWALTLPFLPSCREERPPAHPVREVPRLPDRVQPHQGAGPPHRAGGQQLRAGPEGPLPGEPRGQDPGKAAQRRGRAALATHAPASPPLPTRRLGLLESQPPPGKHREEGGAGWAPLGTNRRTPGLQGRGIQGW